MKIELQQRTHSELQERTHTATGSCATNKQRKILPELPGWQEVVWPHFNLAKLDIKSRANAAALRGVRNTITNSDMMPAHPQCHHKMRLFKNVQSISKRVKSPRHTYTTKFLWYAVTQPPHRLSLGDPSAYLVDTAVEVYDNLACTVIINNLKFPNVSWAKKIGKGEHTNE